MLKIQTLYNNATAALERQRWILPTLARLVFAGVLAVYFYNSGLTKVGDNIWTPAVGAYAQIFPRALEAAGYDASGLTIFHQVVVFAGIFAEFLLPTLIIIGLFTRLAAIGMIGFILMQSLTDLYGHRQFDELGTWFDRFPDALIIDQRAFWVFVLLTLVLKGAGPISIDRLLIGRHRNQS